VNPGTAPQKRPTLTSGGYFEDFSVGVKMRHARGATIDEVENNLLAKLVMNTAQAHWNEDIVPRDHPLGSGRIVFGLLTASLVFGLASEDTADNAIAELGCDRLRFTGPVHHGDSLYAYTEVIAAEPRPEEHAGVVTFQHWGVDQDARVVFHGVRRVLIKSRDWFPRSAPASRAEHSAT
jgi:itaconyl-CoA hydratase